MVIATAGVDRLIRYFGIRPRDQGPMAIIAGHDLAVRKKWLEAPHLSDELLSASYVWVKSSTKVMSVSLSPVNRLGDLLATFRWR